MPLRYIEESGFTAGMVRDVPSWMLPKGSVYDSLNMLYDEVGIARMRMGSTALVSGAQTAFATSLGFCYSRDATTTTEELYGVEGKVGAVYSINKSTGAATAVENPAFPTTNIKVGRPVRHFGFTIFPCNAINTVDMDPVVVAGQTSSTTFSATAATGTTAGNSQITLTGADVTTNIKVGAIIVVSTGSGAGVSTYVGRVVSIETTKIFTVWPVPTVTLAVGGVGTGLITGPTQHAVGGILAGYGGAYGGVCAASFQNRLLYGVTFDYSRTAGTVNRMDRRVTYSPLLTEQGLFGTTFSTPNYGAVFVGSQQWPVLNYFDVPGSDPIVALEPISGNQLLILTATHPVVFSGNLVTQLATTSPTITFDLSDINVNAGCLSDLSVQRTPKGIVWAGPGDIYAWDGRQPVSLTTGTISTYWRGLVRGSSFALHGSAYVRGQYIVSGTSGGSTFSLMCDLTGSTPKWTRASGVGTDIFFGVARPTDPSQVFALRWWDQTGAAPSMTNGQTLRLESMLNPYTAGATTTDADGTAVSASLTTRTITGDPETQKIFQRATVRHQQSSTTAAMTVTAQSKIDAADISAASVRTLGSLSNTSVLTVSNATNANPIVVTTSANHGLQTDDFVDIDGVTGNTNANGRWRISVTGNTTFSLVGGIGNGAFGGSPTCKKLTETDYLASTLNAGQGASVTISGSPNNFELHGIRLGVFEKQPVMSA